MRTSFILPLTCLLLPAFCSCERPIAENDDPDEINPVIRDESVQPGYISPAEIEPIDLGLSVKWAPKNLGAEDIYDGDNSFYAWGETLTKEEFTWENYAFGTSRDLTRYSWGKYGNADDIKPGGCLKPEDDAARANWGEHWRMPTEEEFTELIEKCSWSKDVETMTLTGTGPNGNNIVFPVLGYKIGDKLNSADQISSIAYWTSTISRYDPAFAYQALMQITDRNEALEEKGFEIMMNSRGAGQNRAFGYYIRAVYVK